MARIVAVHGIAQQFQGKETLASVWGRALRDGMRVSGASETDLPDDKDVSLVFFGELFRPKGTKAFGESPSHASDLRDGIELDMLEAWWLAASELADVAGPQARTKLRTPNWVQRALNQLSQSSFFAGLSERAFIGSLKQVSAYFTDSSIREEIQARMAVVVDERTELVIGHSLGSVVAYEALCAHPEWTVRHFITLGSPLGMSNIIFDRLAPPPLNGRGVWPGTVHRWINVADRGDVVALVKTLANRFGEQVRDILVHNGAKAHDVSPYLTSAETGAAVAAALRGTSGRAAM